MTSPVTQVAEVAVNSAVRYPADFPLREAAGRESSSEPSRIIPINVSAITRLMLTDFRIFLECLRGAAESMFYPSLPDGINFMESIHPNHAEGKGRSGALKPGHPGSIMEAEAV